MAASKRAQWVEEMIERWNRGDLDGFFEALGPKFEFTPDPSFPDSGTYRGDEFRKWMREWARTWAENSLEVLGTSERGDSILAESRWHLRAKTGAPVPTFFDRDRALEVVGGAG